MTEATITTRLNGPLLVKGPVKLIDHEGREYDLWLHRDPELKALSGYAPYEELVRPKQ